MPRACGMRVRLPYHDGTQKQPRVADSTARQGWRWQKLTDYTAKLGKSDYQWPKGDGTVYVHVVTTRIRKRYLCQVVIVRHSLGASLSQARDFACSDLEAEAATLLVHIAARWEIEVVLPKSANIEAYQQYSA